MSDERAVIDRLQSELDAGAEFTIAKQTGFHIVTCNGGTQLTGGYMAAGDTMLDAFHTAFDMEDDA
jgi:hypothetical protein